MSVIIDDKKVSQTAKKWFIIDTESIYMDGVRRSLNVYLLMQRKSIQHYAPYQVLAKENR